MYTQTHTYIALCAPFFFLPHCKIKIFTGILSQTPIYILASIQGHQSEDKIYYKINTVDDVPKLRHLPLSPQYKEKTTSNDLLAFDQL